jgi:hypothetical protein
MSNNDNLRRYEPLIDDWNAFAVACARPLPLVLWTNPLRTEALARLNDHDGIAVAAHPQVGDNGEAARRAAAGYAAVPGDSHPVPGALLAARLEARGHECTPLGWYPGGLKVSNLDKPGLTLEYVLGLYHVQEEASLIPVRVLAPRPGERILDLCAAPGGKTAQISVAIACRGTVVANDVRVDRIRALRSNCERLGLLNVAMTAQDGTGFPLEAGPFDAILLDAPCSCEGKEPARAGSARTSSCRAAPACRQRFWVARGSCSPPAAGWCTPPARSLRRRTRWCWTTASATTRASSRSRSQACATRPA